MCIYGCIYLSSNISLNETYYVGAQIVGMVAQDVFVFFVLRDICLDLGLASVRGAGTESRAIVSHLQRNTGGLPDKKKEGVAGGKCEPSWSLLR